MSPWTRCWNSCTAAAPFSSPWTRKPSSWPPNSTRSPVCGTRVNENYFAGWIWRMPWPCWCWPIASALGMFVRTPWTFYVIISWSWARRPSEICMHTRPNCWWSCTLRSEMCVFFYMKFHQACLSSLALFSGFIFLLFFGLGFGLLCFKFWS